MLRKGLADRVTIRSVRDMRKEATAVWRTERARTAHGHALPEAFRALLNILDGSPHGRACAHSTSAPAAASFASRCYGLHFGQRAGQIVMVQLIGSKQMSQQHCGHGSGPNLTQQIHQSVGLHGLPAPGGGGLTG